MPHNMSAGSHACLARPLVPTCLLPNVPQRLSWRRVSGYQDPHVQQFQAGACTCPEDLCGESWPLRTRSWRCGPSSNSDVPTRAMPNNLPASRKTCLAGPLHKSSSLHNVSPAVTRRRVSSSFFLSPNPRRHGSIPSTFPPHSGCSDSSGSPASHASTSDANRRGMQIFSPCPPRPAVPVSPRRPGRFFAPYQRSAAGQHHHSDEDADADSCYDWHIVDRRHANNSSGKVPGSPCPCPIGIPSRIPVSNRFQELSDGNGFGPDVDSDSTPGPAKDDFSDVTSSSPRPPHGGVSFRSAKTHSCLSSLHGSHIDSASSRGCPHSSHYDSAFDWAPPQDPPCAPHLGNIASDGRGKECIEKCADGEGPNLSIVVRPRKFRPGSNSIHEIPWFLILSRMPRGRLMRPRQHGSHSQSLANEPIH